MLLVCDESEITPPTWGLILLFRRYNQASALLKAWGFASCISATKENTMRVLKS